MPTGDTTRPTCKPFFEPQLAVRRLVTGITVTGDGHVYLIGGLGMNLCFVSKDRGETFAPFPVAQGTGLRSILVEPKATFVCGERGFLARSTDGGETFEPIDVGARSCLQTVLRADGVLWTTGDPGVFRSRDDGATWERVGEIDGEVCRPQASAHGLLLPTSSGRLYICRDGKIRRTTLDTDGNALWAACASPRGTILAVGAEGIIERSEDGGKTFQRITAPYAQSLENVLCTDDGRFVAIGTPAAVMYSDDDGRTFEKPAQVHTAFNGTWMFGLARLEDRVLVGMDQGFVFELGDRTPEKSDGERAKKKLVGGKGDLAKVSNGREHFWFEAAPVKGKGKTARKDGVDRYWRGTGAKHLEVTFEKGSMTSLRTFDDDGGLRTEETFAAGKPPPATPGMRVRGSKPRPIVTRFCAHTGDGNRLVIECDEKGVPTRFEAWKGDKRGAVIDAAKLSKVPTPKTFKTELERRFGKLLEMRGVVVYHDFFEVSNADHYAFDEIIKLSVVVGDGGGNEVIVIEEGKHAGKVFFNDHEEGLSSMDSIGEHVEEEGLDVEALGKDELVEAMPFFDAKLADDLGGFLRGIQVASNVTYYGKLADYEPVD